MTEYAVEVDGEIYPANSREGAEEWVEFRRSIGDDARAITRSVEYGPWIPVSVTG